MIAVVGGHNFQFTSGDNMIFLALILNTAFASQWTTKEFFPSSWANKQLCEKLGTSKCFEITEHPSQYKIMGNDVVFDLAKDSEWKAVKSQKAALDAKNSSISEEIINQQKCMKAIATVRYYNKSRQLSKPQRQAMRAAMKPIIELLVEGDSEGAKELIQAVSPDGAVITQAIKDEILGLL